MRLFGIAGVQQYLSASHSNIDGMVHQIQKVMAIYPWVQMIIFSELAAYGPLISHAKKLPCPGIKKLADTAKKHGVWLLPGTMFEKDGELIYNTAPIIDPLGNIVANYRKIFPFEPYETGVTPGNQPYVFQVPNVGVFGVSICYDLWFPETARTLVSMGAEVILHPSHTATIDRDLELSIVRAAAVQNQSFIFDVNGVAAGGVGKSIVVGPHGNILHQAGSAEEIFPLEIDLAQVTHSRERGVLNLGQPLKSLRDTKWDFDFYKRKINGEPLFDWLGPLRRPGEEINFSKAHDAVNIEKVN